MSKPTKSEVPLKNVDTKVKLQCQEVIPFSTNKHINLPETFIITSDHPPLSAEERERYKKQEFILGCVRNIQNPSSNIIILHGRDVYPFFQNSKFPQCKLDQYHLLLVLLQINQQSILL